MDRKNFVPLLQNLSDALHRWADWLPGDRDATKELVNVKYEFHEIVDDERNCVLAWLGADRRGYLGDLVERALKRVLRAGQKFAAACDGLTPSGKEFWQDIAHDNIPVSDSAYPAEFGVAVAWLLEALYRCENVLAAVDKAIQQADSNGGEADSDGEEADGFKPRLSPQKQEIVEIVRRAGQRLTGEQILSKLSENEKDVSPGTTANYLAQLTSIRILTNRQDVDRPGYGLPDWPSSI